MMPKEQLTTGFLTPEQGARFLAGVLAENGEAIGRFHLPNELPPVECAVEVELAKVTEAGAKAQKDGVLDYTISNILLLPPGGAWLLTLVEWPGVQKLTLAFRVARNREFLEMLTQTRRLWLFQKGSRNGEITKATLLEEIPVDSIVMALLLTALIPEVAP